MFLNELFKIVVLSLIVESVWESLKMLWQRGKISIDRIGALSIGILLSIGAKIDLLELAGVSLIIPYLGMILTGLLISRGSNFTHDLIKKIIEKQNSN